MWKKAKRPQKNDVPTAYHIIIKIQYINKHNMVIFYRKWKKYNKIQLTKNEMDLIIRKMTNHPPSPMNSPTVKKICLLQLSVKCERSKYID